MKCIRYYQTRKKLKREIWLLQTQIEAARAKIEEISRERDRWMSQTF
jgi:cell division protein FtsB